MQRRPNVGGIRTRDTSLVNPAAPVPDAPRGRQARPPAYRVEVGVGPEGDDLAQALELLERVYPGKFDRSVWEWKYSAHYLGPPRIAVARLDGRIVGLQPSIRHQIWWRGRRETAYQLTDVLTHPEHRRRGIFSALVEAFAAAAGEEGAACVFTFPNRLSYPGFARLGTWSHPFSLPLLVRAPLPGLGRRALPSAGGLRTGAVESFDPAVDRLGEDRLRRFQAATLRDHRYLNWRYLQAPRRPYTCIGARDGNAWRGYAVGRISRWLGVRVGLIVDLLGDAEALERVLPAMGEALLDHGARALGVLLLPGTPEWDLLHRLGYRTLPVWAARKEFYFLLRVCDPLSAGPGERTDWWLTWGNIDIA